MNKRLLIAFTLVLGACSQEGAYSNVLEIEKDAGAIKLEDTVKGNWTKVCFFAPYSNNASAKKVLGFHWNLEKNSRISENDGITLAVFAKGNTVVHHREIPRYADFTSFSGQCFSKADANFYVAPGGVTHTVSKLR